MYELQTEGERDKLTHALTVRPDLATYLGASVREGFDYTSTRMMLDENEVAGAERAEYGAGKSVFWDPNPFDPVTEHDQYRQYRDRRGQLPVMDKDAWEQSPYHRKGMAWRDDMTPVRAKIMAREYDARQRRREILARGGGGLRSVLGFGAQMLGNFPDPINFLPLGGAMREGSILARAGRAAVEGAAGAAIADAVVMPDLARRGADLGWADFALDVVFGAALGGGLGAAGAKLHDKLQKRRVRRLREAAPPDVRQALGAAMEKALADEADGRPVDVAPVLRESDALRRVEETTDLARLYEHSLFHPIQADPEAHQVRLRSLVAESLDPVWNEIVVDMGSGKPHKGRIQREVGYGLVKIIYEHGEGSRNKLGKQVAKEDLLDFPNVVRDYRPSDVTSKADGTVAMSWVVPGKNGGNVLHAVKVFRDTDGRPHLVTSHVLNDSSPYRLSRKVGEKEKAALLASRQASFEGLPDTGMGASTRPHDGVLSHGASKSADQYIRPERPGVNWATEQPDDYRIPAAPKSEAEVLRAMDIDPDTRMSPEEFEVERLDREGQLSGEDVDEILNAREVDERAAKYEDAGLSVIECVLKVVDDAE